MSIVAGWQTTDKDGYKKYTYYFNEKGIPLASEWAKLMDEDNTGYAWYYFDVDGRRVENFCVLDNSGWCYLDSNGKWVQTKSGEITFRKKTYKTDDAGHLIIPGTWEIDDNGQWRYKEEGSYVGGFWVLDKEGLCYVNTDGYLFSNQWVGNDENGWSYLDENGHAVSSTHQLGSKGWCYIGPDGYSVKDVFIEDYFLEYTSYYNGEGYKIYSDWAGNDDNGWYYFDSYGRMIKDGWARDTKGWCYLDSDGKRQKSGIVTIRRYNYTITDGYLVQPGYWEVVDDQWKYKEGDSYITGAWRFDSSGLCYLDDNGYLTYNIWVSDDNGWTRIGPNGNVIVNDWVAVDNKWHYCKSNGYLLVDNLWTDSTGRWVYLNAYGEMLINWWAKINDFWYFFGDDGYKVDGWKDVWSSKYQKSYKYYFQPTNSEVNKGVMVTGWKTINGKTYYFNEDDTNVNEDDTNGFPEGAMMIGWWTISDEGTYYFNSDGSRYEGEWLQLGNNEESWNVYDDNGQSTYTKRWYAFNEKHQLQTGWIKKPLDRYYYSIPEKNHQNHGQVVFGWYYAPAGGPAETEAWYYFDDRGNSGSVLTNSWKRDAGGKRWLDDKGQYIIDVIKEINEAFYYIDKDGYLVTTPGFTNNNKSYVMTKEGVLARNHWEKVDDFWYYFDNNGLKVVNSFQSDSTGICFLNGEGKSVSEGVLVKKIGEATANIYVIQNGYVLINSWYSSSKGWAWCSQEGAFSSGWIFDKGFWYFLETPPQTDQITVDEFLEMQPFAIGEESWEVLNLSKLDKLSFPVAVQGEKIIEGKTYFFATQETTTNGITFPAYAMFTNSWVNATSKPEPFNYIYVDGTGAALANRWMLYTSENDVQWIYTGSDGHAVQNQWAKDSIDWCYLGSNGYMVTNSWVMDSVGRCYIGEDGYIVRNTIIEYENKKYYIGEDGHLRNAEWIKINKDWYFIINGEIYKPGDTGNPWIKDGHDWYYLDTDGKMVHGEWRTDSLGWCFLQENSGKMVRNEWHKGDPNKEDNWCYINNMGYALQVENGTRKTAFINGYYYLFEDKIYNGKKYSIMIVNEAAEVSGINPNEKGENGTDIYWFGYNKEERWNGKGCPFRWEKDGNQWRAYYPSTDDPPTNKLLTNSWAKDLTGLCYVNNDGIAVQGWNVIDNVQYYFDENCHMITNDWAKDDQGWKYLNHKGIPVKDTERTINKEIFIFDETGYWIG